MPQARRALKKWDDFNIPVSYRINETGDKLRDASNVHTRQNRLTTRNGLSRFNSTSVFSGNSILSLSFFQNVDLESYYIAKSHNSLFSVASGTSIQIKGNLSNTTKHRGLTLNNRHILAIETDGLFQFNGTNVTQLGQSAPSSAPVIDNDGFAGGTLNDGRYRLKTTFYDSTNGFESNASIASGAVNPANGDTNKLTFSVPIEVDNANIDKVRVYAQVGADGGTYYYMDEFDLDVSVSERSISSNPDSSQVPPTTHAAPLAGGGKYLTEFNNRLAYSGNSTYKNDVFFSEQNIPDAFDDNGDSQTVLNIPGDGAVTGIATGLFSDSVLDPYLVIFKKTSTHIYSEIAGYGRFNTLNTKIGCISHETIEVINGSIYFMSANGWNAIINGQLAKDNKGNAYTLGQGDIDDIFTEKGFAYELDKTAYSDYHSVYYQPLRQYITFVTQKGSGGNRRAYVYEQDSFGFKPYDFELNITASMNAKDSTNDDIILFSDDAGFLYSHSVKEDRTDVDKDGNDVLITALVYLNWTSGSDDDASYNFRELILKAVATDDITIKTWLNYRLANLEDYTYSFSEAGQGFILDVSKLDVAALSDGRPIVRSRADINRVGTSILIGFYQKVANGDLKIFTAQLNMSKNGNPN